MILLGATSVQAIDPFRTSLTKNEGSNGVVKEIPRDLRSTGEADVAEPPLSPKTPLGVDPLGPETPLGLAPLGPEPHLGFDPFHSSHPCLNDYDCTHFFQYCYRVPGHVGSCRFQAYSLFLLPGLPILLILLGCISCFCCPCCYIYVCCSELLGW